jgi:GntR family transcriptional regulator
VPDPLHQWIAEDLRRKIASGELAPGMKLPSEDELQVQYDVGRNTVRRAVDSLADRGLLQKRRGLGTFVVIPPEAFVITLSADRATGLGGGEGQAYHAEARAQGRQPSASIPKVGFISADDRIAKELAIPPGASLVTRYQERLIDGKPYSLQTSYYPMSLAGAGATKLVQAELIHPGTVTYLREELGIRQARYSDTVSVRLATGSEAMFFRSEISDLISVLEQRRVAYDDQGKPFRLAVSAFATNRNQFVVYAGQVPAEARLRVTIAPTDAEETEDA